MTGNAGKLREVREILAQAHGTPIEIESRDLDRECEPLLLARRASPFHTYSMDGQPMGFFFSKSQIWARKFVLTHWNIKVPEIQGTTQQVATEKCRRAAELVRSTYYLSLFFSPPPLSESPLFFHHTLGAPYRCYNFLSLTILLIDHLQASSHKRCFCSKVLIYTIYTCQRILDRRPRDHGRHCLMFRRHERPTRPLHQVFLARARSRGYVSILYSYSFTYC